MMVETKEICIACLNYLPVNKDGLCKGCTPEEESHRKSLIDLLRDEKQTDD